MKRVITMLFLCVVIAFARDVWNITEIDGTTVYGKLDGNGNLTIMGDITAAGGIVNIKDIFLDVATADTDTICSQAISTATLLALATTWSTSDFLTDSFITPRNIVARVYWQIEITTKTFVGSAVVTGINANGISTTETLALSTDTVTGNVAFASLTSIVISATTITAGAEDSNVTFNIGTGDKIGLSNNVDAQSDVYNINEAGSKVALSSLTMNTTYNTIDFSSDGNGSNDYSVTYKARGKN